MRKILLALAVLLSLQASAQTVPSPTPSGPGGLFNPSDVFGLFGGKVDLGARREIDNVVSRGADPTGVADATSFLKASLATGRTVYVPPGDFRLRQMLTELPGQCIVGEGRTRSTLHVSADFDPTAGAVIQAATGTVFGGCLRDVGIVFDQPSDQASRSNFRTLVQGCTSALGGTGCKYPPAVLVSGAARAVIEGVRISGAWDGIIGQSNIGGLWYNKLEIGALNIGLSIDSSLDFCHLSGLHFWPWGMDTGNIYTGVYADGQTIAANLGRCDDYDIRGFTAFNGALNILSSVTQLDAVNVVLDGDHANLNIAGGFNNIVGFTSTKNNPYDSAITVTGGQTHLSTIDLRGTSNAPLLNQTGGLLQINGGGIVEDNLAFGSVQQTGGVLEINAVAMSQAAGARTTPLIHIGPLAPAFRLTNSRWDGVGNSTGGALQIDSDSPSNFVVGNDFAGWATSLPISGLTGTYGPNKAPAVPFTPSIGLSTPGTFAPNYSVQTGHYWFTGAGIEYDFHMVFTTNAYTGASGTIVLNGPPLPSNPVAPSFSDYATAQVTRVGGFGLGGLTQVTVQQIGNGQLYLLASASATPATPLGTGSIPASGGPFEIAVHGLIPTN